MCIYVYVERARERERDRVAVLYDMSCKRSYATRICQAASWFVVLGYCRSCNVMLPCVAMYHGMVQHAVVCYGIVHCAIIWHVTLTGQVYIYIYIEREREIDR